MHCLYASDFDKLIFQTCHIRGEEGFLHEKVWCLCLIYRPIKHGGIKRFASAPVLLNISIFYIGSRGAKALSLFSSPPTLIFTFLIYFFPVCQSIGAMLTLSHPNFNERKRFRLLTLRYGFLRVESRDATEGKLLWRKQEER